MKPTTSFWDNFSNEGRIKKLWMEALTETDREKSLALLRSALHEMCQPTALVNLWLPFLDVFFARECVQSLNASDFADVEKMGWYVQQTPGLHKAPPASTIWQRIIEAYHARGEYLLARKLATKIHQCQLFL